MTDTTALHRTVVRLAAIDDTTVTLVIPATDFDQVVFARDDVHIPRWLLNKEVGYRFFAMVPILAEMPEQVTLWNCENDPRTPAEQIAHSHHVLGIEPAAGAVL